ncbi:two-component system sensor histidine kinase NtrB [Mongoliimonas terrestris]|uniref:two-component system sensor histidine kinase NtrB n=1 Tax=Mongoliimonas terrestris TaxID=1709001 RepID=UPI0009495542|nr:PAS domain S-box protein [Mongoliimonas terrestris]
MHTGAPSSDIDPQPERAPVSEARFASVLDTAADGIVVIDERGTILAFNKSCEQMFGHTAAEVIGQNVKMIMPPSYAVEHDRYISHYRKTGERKIIGIGREVAGMHSDGTIFPVELSVGEAPTTEGRQFIGILRDLRPRKQTEQRLSQLQAQIMHMTRLSAMDEMGAAMAHELNQPLTALMLYLQAVMRQTRVDSGKPLRPEQIRTIMEKALNEAERAGGIIQRMRQMVEKRDPERSRIDLVDVVEEAIDLTAFVAQGSTVTIRRVVPAGAVEVEADPIQIQQIVLNLLRNAVEVAKDSADKWVEVRVKDTDRAAVVEVEDSGAGISAETAATLFRTFSTTKKTGMGLGLAISRSIAQNHGGDLSVVPGGDGRGAIFTLSLPTGDRHDQATNPGDG